MRTGIRFLVAVLLVLSLAAGAPMRADEGMWTLDNPPLKRLQEKYGFTPTPEWLEHVRLSSVRFNDGGSGSFVSPNGLVLTNHHVGAGQLQKLSTPQNDFVANGFHARKSEEEPKCPDLELNVLVAMENVTARVMGSVKPGMNAANALKARRAEGATIEKEAKQGADQHAEVVSLYNGGEYWLYRYKKYTDVRLVFAPEQQIAFFGGDPDNFTFPRYDLDFALFRAYENGNPVQSKHFLKWSPRGAAEGELIFISGHPGSTDRESTVAQLESQRDVQYPAQLRALRRRLAALRTYAARGPEEARQAAGLTFGYENSLKALGGEYEGLRDKNIFAKKQQDEAVLRRQVAARPEWQQSYGDAWDAIDQAEKKASSITGALIFQAAIGPSLPNRAQQIVRYVVESKKPDGERLPGYHDSELESLRFRMFSPAPVYPAMDEALLADALEQALEELGPDNGFVRAALAGKKPAEVAREVISATKVGDVAFRKSLVEGGEAAVVASTDPLIQYARRIDPVRREMRKWLDENVTGIETPAGEKIGQARFAVFGKSNYPDATFTLRLTYGTVKGYPMNGTIAPVHTTFYGLYDRAYSFGLKPPFHLPQRYLDRKDKLDLTTPLNFVCTGDIIGGNSGSPVINRDAELVGLVFDGNIESLVGRFVYNDEKNRTVAVHSRAIVETLRKVYDAGAIADELQGKTAAAK